MHDAFYFDLDGTLTENGGAITNIHASLLMILSRITPVIIITNSTREMIHAQIPLENISHLAQNGNDAWGKTGMPLWQNRLSNDDIFTSFAHIEKLLAQHGTALDPSLLTRNECRITYDLRDILMNGIDIVHEDILANTALLKQGFTAALIDKRYIEYTRDSGTKGENLRRHIDMFAYRDPVYFGTLAFSRDESLAGACRTVPVKNHHHTFSILHKMLRCIAKK